MKKRNGEWKKSYSRGHTRLYERADSLKALGSVASYLENGIFYSINDRLCCCCDVLRAKCDRFVRTMRYLFLERKVSAVVMCVALSHCPFGSRLWHTAGEAPGSGGFPLDPCADSAKLA
jgi:hypothetical protein